STLFFIHHTVIHSLPTRRSSDLRLKVRDAQMAQVLCLAYLQNRTLQEIARHERLGSRERARGVLRAAEAWVDACLFSLHAEQSRSEEHTSELQSREKLVCRLLLE